MQTVTKVSHKFALTLDRTERLKRLAEARRISESEVVEKALDVYFDLADASNPQDERRGWSRLSEGSLQYVWDNDQDAVYDNWRDLYGIPER